MITDNQKIFIISILVSMNYNSRLLCSSRNTLWEREYCVTQTNNEQHALKESGMSGVTKQQKEGVLCDVTGRHTK